MTSIRKVLLLVTTIALAAFALPAIATGGVDYFRLSVPPLASGGAQSNFTITITNKAPFDYLKSFTITAPAGVTISNVQSASSYIPASKISATSTNISVSGIAIPYGQSGAVKMTATFPAAACTDTAYTWQATAKGGLIVNNEVFTLDVAHSTIVTTVPKGCFTVTPSSSGNGSISPSTAQSVLPNGTAQFTLTPNPLFSVGTVTGTCGGTLAGNVFTTAAVTANCTVIANFVPNVLSIASAPTSAAANSQFSVTVGVSPPGAAVSANTAGCDNASIDASASPVFKFTIPAGSTITSCTIAFSATNYLPAPLTLNLKVFAATTAECGPADPAGQPLQFYASCSSNDVNVSGFAAGYRGPNKNLTCASLNYTLTNNICGTNPQDANGNFIPPNAVSFVWDQASQQVAFSYTVTWKAEYVDPVTGLPFAQRTKACVGSNPNPCGDLNNANDPSRKPLKACLSPLVAFASIPSGEPACISEEDWVTVPQSECASLPVQPPDPKPACTRTTSIITDAVDPPIIRN